MGVILDGLQKHSPDGVHNLTRKTVAPDEALEILRKANNVRPAPMPGLGEIEREVGGHDTEDVVVLDPFEQRVKELVESAGGHYNFKAAVGAGLIKRVDPELLAAMGRLEKAAPLLNKAVAMARARQRTKGQC